MPPHVHRQSADQSAERADGRPGCEARIVMTTIDRCRLGCNLLIGDSTCVYCTRSAFEDQADHSGSGFAPATNITGTRMAFCATAALADVLKGRRHLGQPDRISVDRSTQSGCAVIGRDDGDGLSAVCVCGVARAGVAVRSSRRRSSSSFMSAWPTTSARAALSCSRASKDGDW